MKYVAKKDHQKPCDYCGHPILIGDRCKKWCWTNEEWEGPGARGPYGGICRAHMSCEKIARREHLGEDRFNTGCLFEGADEDRYNNRDGENPTALADEAFTALMAAREAEPTPQWRLRRAVVLLEQCLPILQPDAPLRHYKNDAVRDEVRKFLEKAISK